MTWRKKKKVQMRFHPSKTGRENERAPTDITDLDIRDSGTPQWTSTWFESSGTLSAVERLRRRRLNAGWLRSMMGELWHKVIRNIRR